jgi:hypothetical protein
VIAATLKALVLEQCLPILITKASGIDVSIDRMSVPAIALTRDDQLHVFQQEFMHRRLLAETPDLVSILQAVSHQPSWDNTLERRRDEFLHGRLDVPAFVRERKTRIERPRTFPLFVQRRHFDTPENRIAAGTLHRIRSLLANEVFPAKSAEAVLARANFRQLSRLCRAEPFNSVAQRAALSRKDLALTRFRVNRRMTGNDRPYRQLLDWIENWLALSGLSEEKGGDLAVDLSLPESESYWEKIFEIWCLEQARASLARLGWTTDSDFRIHASVANSPIATFHSEGRHIDLYFQMQKPMGQGRWLNQSTQKSLRGMPDVVLAAPGSAPLLIDAKWRFRTMKQFTSEEHYKMLGYAENFAHNQPNGSFSGLLVFPSDVLNAQTFVRVPGGRLTTMRTDFLSPAFAASFDVEISEWLKVDAP